DLRVVGLEEPGDLGRSALERGEEEDAVGEALRPGQAHDAGRAAGRLQLERIHASRASRAPAKGFSSASPCPASISASTSESAARKRFVSSRIRSRLARQMSRHISGWLEALRVKSQNPPAARPKSSAALPRRAMSCTSA